MSTVSASLSENERATLPTETELKLSLPANQAKQIWNKTPLSTLLDDTPSRLRLYSAYYDTSHLDLRRRGVALRLRRQGRRWVQTLKTTGLPAGALQQRIELEMPVARGLPDLQLLKQSGLSGFAADVVAMDALKVIFTTDFVRSVAVVEPVPGTRIEVCVDQGDVVAGTKRETVCEIELELKQGELSALFHLARQLAAHPDIRIETVSKAQRGYRLAARDRRAPARASGIELSPKDSADQLFTTLAFACIFHLQANEYGVAHTRDIEYLHQARIALRRLRSVFSVFSIAVPRTHFSEQLAWLSETGRVLGEARNWDVFMTDFWPKACAGIADHSAIPYLTRTAARLRADARRRARNALSSPDYSIGMLCLTEKLLEQGWCAERSIDQRDIAALPAKSLAAAILGRAHRKLAKQVRRLNRDHHHDLHQLRIRIKKLRYAIELLAPLWQHQRKDKYLSQLAVMQKTLGEINDAATAGRLLDQLATASRDGIRLEAIAYLRGYGDAMSSALLSGFDAAWKGFVRTKPFW